MGKLSDEDKIMCVELYHQGLTYKQIAEKYDVVPQNIHQLLKRRGVKSRPKYDISNHSISPFIINHDYFKKIDNPVKAQILGLFAADGCNEKKENHFSISLKIDDKKYLQDISDFLGSDRPLYDLVPKFKGKIFKQCKLKITSKSICQDLYNLGIVPRKSLVLKYPSIDPELDRYFIRGYFEGDGSIYQNHNKSGKSLGFSMTFAGTLDIVNKINGIICRYLNEDNLFRIYNYKNYNVGCIRSQKLIYKTLSWIYEGNRELLLERKFRYLDIVRKRRMSIDKCDIFNK